MDNQPIAPDDPELKNIIDKLANFVARNGPEFEKMTKHKQMNNPKFNFLYGGEHFNYYQCKVATEQQIMRQRKEKLAQQQAIIQDVITQQSIQSAPWQQQQQHPLPMPPQMPTPQMQQPPPQMAPPPWQQPQPQPHPQPQPPPPMPHPAQPLAPPHHPALQQQQQQQQQLQFQQQHMQQQLQAEKEKQDQLLKEQQEKEQLEQEQQQILGEREQLQAQIKESEENLQKQHEVFLLQQQEQIELGIVSAQNQEIQNLAKELEVDIGDFDTRLQTIIDSCTKDAISNGKLWIFSWAKSDKHCLLIAHYLLHKIIPLGTPFEAKLHLIYLINDVTHHCMRRGAGNLQQALGQVVGPIFCSTYLSADEEKKKKLEKVLKLWETNKYFGDDVMIALKNPESSMSAFKAGQLEQFSEVVSHVREGIAEQLSRLQKQHDEFVDHVNSMIQGLDARLDKLTGNDQSTVEARQEADDQGPDGNDVNTSMPGNNLPPASMSMMGAGGMPGIIPGAPGSVSSGPGMPPVPIDPAAMATMFPNFDPSVPPPGFGSIPRVPFQPGLPPPNFPPPQPGMPPPMPMLHPPNHPRGPIPPMPDFSKPPPGFNEFPQDFPPDFNPNVLPPDMEIMPLDPNDPSLMPEVPYFDLPAGLMAPLVKLEDTEYEPLDPEDIRLPPPQPPSKRLLAAVEAFYAPPSREAPRNSEGWEQNGLFEFFKAKQKYSKLKKERLEHEGVQRKVHIPSPIRRDSSSSRSPSPRLEEDAQRSRRRYRSKSRSRSRSKSPVRRRRSVSPSRSRSRSPPYRRRSNSRSPPPRRRNRSRSRSRSRTPPRRRRERSRSPSPDFGIQPFYQTNTNTRLGEENKGALLMKKMGWGGQGLGAREQGIVDPVSGGEVRDKIDMYRGVGMEINDPFESFRKNKSSSFMTRMKARAAKSGK